MLGPVTLSLYCHLEKHPQRGQCFFLTRMKTPPPPMTRSLRKDLNPLGKTLPDEVSGPNLDS